MPRRLLAEAVGTGALVMVVVGSGIAAQELSPGEVGLQLLENSTATVLGLAVMILVLGPVSGAHLNPVVSLADWFLGRDTGGGLAATEVAAYASAQVAGALGGASVANLMFALPVVQVSGKTRLSGGHVLGEVVATAGLVVVVFILTRSGRTVTVAAPAVAGYIGAAYWFTSSTSFANPAVTLGRVLSDTFAGIAPGSAAGFIAAQVAGAAVGVALVLLLHPHPHPGRALDGALAATDSAPVPTASGDGR